MIRVRVAAACALLVIASAACSSDKPKASSSTSTTFGIIPGTNFEVSGTVTKLLADRAATDPLAPPFTITVPDRGNGGAEIASVTVNDKDVQINWGTGQPLPWSGTGAGLNLNEIKVELDLTSIVWSLDGAARDVLPGTYSLGSSVAVGAGGLGKPVDKVTFVASEISTLSTRGGARITQSPRTLRLEGKAGTLGLIGQFVLRTPSGDRNVRRLTFGEGTYEVTLSPGPDGFNVTGRLAGKVVA
ncbi:MAG TPA: hypothetical protein VFB78_12275 [Acidimicrobiales bacterium]|nr:hypothetical protein [Acidimicrobiales bacterium]